MTNRERLERLEAAVDELQEAMACEEAMEGNEEEYGDPPPLAAQLDAIRQQMTDLHGEMARFREVVNAVPGRIARVESAMQIANQRLGQVEAKVAQRN